MQTPQTMQITKVDITRYADFTVNIPDSKVDFQINDAALMDVAPVVGTLLFERIKALPEVGEMDAIDAGFWMRLVPFWAMCAYKRLFALHGVDVAQAGVVQPRGQDYEQISDKRRGEILGAIRSKVVFYQNALEDYMREHDLLPRPDACSTPYRRRSTGIAIAKRRR